MKRSEMLSIIWDAINELEDANSILTAIENAGMLPPGKYLEGTENTVDPIRVHRWDPEDEIDYSEVELEDRDWSEAYGEE